MPSINRSEFVETVKRARRDWPGDSIVVPVAMRLLSDQLTPVLAYRRLVAADERTAPSFLLESVEGGERNGRYSILSAEPETIVMARGVKVSVSRRSGGKKNAFQNDKRRDGRDARPTKTESRSESGPHVETREADPFDVLKRYTSNTRLIRPASVGAGAAALPRCALGGWFGYAGYDTVRLAEPVKLDVSKAPPDDRDLPDLCFALYDRVVVFDHVQKLVYAICSAQTSSGDDAGEVYDRALDDLESLVTKLETHSKPLRSGRVDQSSLEAGAGSTPLASNMTPEAHAAMVARAKEYIRAGDIFQVVLGQRFERRSAVDPFDVYRALRAVNPSPYMVYMQAPGCILVASSPEILCRVRRDEATGRRIVTNRPLAGTRRRGATAQEDEALERELLASAKERAEHVMLVDLGRNDVGKVCELASIEMPAVMQIERYSHVMHISTTVTGVLKESMSCWEALRATLPVGTVSGAPKIRAMQIIDELEPVRRGPYGGGMGSVSLEGDMDIALALRTIVTPTALRAGDRWVYHLQAAGGIVADSDAETERQETVNKAAALAQAIDLAERAFGDPPPAIP